MGSEAKWSTWGGGWGCPRDPWSRSERCPGSPLGSCLRHREPRPRAPVAGAAGGSLLGSGSALRYLPHPVLENCLSCILPGKGAVFIILEPLIPSLVLNTQYYFPFGDECCSFLPETGSVFAFGENKMGQLGLGNQTDAVPSPAQVPALLRLQGLCFSLLWGWIFWGEIRHSSPLFELLGPL